MFTRLSKVAAVLSGVTASLVIVSTAAIAQQAPVVVQAQPLDGVRSERVSYADLDLASAKSERKLNLRVAGAVKRVCDFDKGIPGLQPSGYYNCSDFAWDGARPQIAQAVARARQLAMTGKSDIAAVAITIAAPAS